MPRTRTDFILNEIWVLYTVALASAFQKDRPQNSKRSPFIPNKIKMTQFLVRVAYVFLFLTFKK